MPSGTRISTLRVGYCWPLQQGRPHTRARVVYEPSAAREACCVLFLLLDFGQFTGGRIHLNRERLAVPAGIEGIDRTRAVRRFHRCKSITADDLAGFIAG